MQMKTAGWCALAAILVAITTSGSVDAAPVALAVHFGDVNPATEGWTRGYDPGTGGVVTEGPIIDSAFSNTPAWFIDDDAANTAARPGRGNLGYRHALSSAEASDAVTSGWKMSAYMRVVDAGHKFEDRVGQSPLLLFNDGATDYVLGFRRENTTSGDLIVQLSEGSIANPDGSYSATGRQVTVAGDAYHLIELVYDPQAGLARLLIDGTVLINDYAGRPYNLRGPSVSFGAGETPAFGRAHYNLVRLMIVPEPATLGMLALGGLGLLGCRRARLATSRELKDW